jgi:hypothetical protein
MPGGQRLLVDFANREHWKSVENVYLLRDLVVGQPLPSGTFEIGKVKIFVGHHIGSPSRICPTARGAHGQMLYVDPTLDIVIARFGSAPDAPSYLLDHILLPTIDAICRELT